MTERKYIWMKKCWRYYGIDLAVFDIGFLKSVHLMLQKSEVDQCLVKCQMSNVRPQQFMHASALAGCAV